MTAPPTSMPNEAENKRAPGLASTRTLMKELHAGQTDLEGQPYAFHPMRVARNVRLLDPNVSDEVLMAALLHDTIEDCGIDEGFLRAKGFTDNTITMVRLVTKPEGDTRSYAEVIEDLIASGNRSAMIVKLADNMDNLHPQRVAALKAKTWRRLIGSRRVTWLQFKTSAAQPGLMRNMSFNLSRRPLLCNWAMRMSETVVHNRSLNAPRKLCVVVPRSLFLGFAQK